MLTAMLLLAVLLFAFPGSLAQAPLEVPTEHGPVLGHIVEQVNNGEFSADVRSFLGVPYGASTAGENRFRVSIGDV